MAAHPSRHCSGAGRIIDAVYAFGRDVEPAITGRLPLQWTESQVGLVCHEPLRLTQALLSTVDRIAVPPPVRLPTRQCPGERQRGLAGSDYALSGRDLAPLGPPAHPGVRKDLRRGQPRALVHGGPASASPRPRLHLPQLAVGTDEHIPTATLLGTTIPPMPLDPHWVTLAHRACAGNPWHIWRDPLPPTGCWLPTVADTR